MSQRQRLFVDSDVTVDGYTPTPMWDEVDNTDDGTFITSPLIITPKSCEMGVKTGEKGGDPLVDTASLPFNLTIRIKRNASGGQVLTASMGLYQGAVLIAERTGIIVGNSFVTYVKALSEAQVAAITDWTDLRIRIGVAGSIDLPVRKLEISSVFMRISIWSDTRIRGAGSTLYGATIY